jgi:hypothetical protein
LRRCAARIEVPVWAETDSVVAGLRGEVGLVLGIACAMVIDEGGWGPWRGGCGGLVCGRAPSLPKLNMLPGRDCEGSDCAREGRGCGD